MTMSRVLEMPASRGERASAYFGAKLQMETDATDVYFDLQHAPGRFIMLDARSPESFARGHVSGAVSMYYRAITAESTATWNKDTPIIVYSVGPACNGATKAAAQLSTLGFLVKEMIGGFESWQEEGYPIERSAAAS
jgi:rhodanese-related sulfurtransferase